MNAKDIKAAAINFSGYDAIRHVELPPAGPSYVRQEALPGEHLANLAPLYV